MTKRLVLLMLSAALAFAGDLTGKWTVEVETDQGSGTPSWTLKQDGNKVSGKYAGMLGDQEMKGTVNGDEFELSFPSEYGPVKYTGRIDGDKVSGKVDLAGQATGTFKGTRAK